MADRDTAILLGARRLIERDGCAIGYHVAGGSGPVLLLFSAWQIVHAAAWRAQVPYLSTFARVITIDCRGNGRSGRPATAEAYSPWELLADALAVLDAEGIEHAIVGGFSYGGHLAALFAAYHPDRTQGAILLAPTAPFGPSNLAFRLENLLAERENYAGLEKYSFAYWRRDYADFADFFMREVFCEPHSEKHIEDGCAWAAETDAETLIKTIAARRDCAGQGEDAYAAIHCPVLLIHGTEDRVVPYAKSAHIAKITGARLRSVPRAGHMPSARMPAKVNGWIRDFLLALHGQSRPKPRRPSRRPRALFLSSPIGLGHARRDLAIADALRARRPDLDIEWLAQEPVTRLLATRNERVHPASHRMLQECAHIRREADGEALNALLALRRMDGILIANFCHFQDVIEAEGHDLVIADEAWEIDRFWHEHPELKRAKLAWITDFVGVLPLPEGGTEEARLAADWNAEMINWVERNMAVRDAALFMGSPADIVDADFGPGLPSIRDWTMGHFAFPGYVDPLAEAHPPDRSAFRRRLGYRPDETVCLVAVGGSGVGQPLLERIAAVAPALMRSRPGLRFEVVTGPGIDPASLHCAPGLTLRYFVADFPAYAAACDLALVQGGLSTCMELASLGRPFAYLPLERHFEQQIHVDFRLRRLGVGRRLLPAELAAPDDLGAVLDALIATPPPPAMALTGAATRTAGHIAALI